MKKSQTQTKKRRNDHIESFYDEVDSGKINIFEDEESFMELLAAFRRKASVLPKYMKLEGMDNVEFKIFCPLPHFGAIVSKFTFDRKSEVSFRYLELLLSHTVRTCLFFRSYANHYSLVILLTKREDAEWILGKKAIETRTNDDGSITEVLCNELFPIKLSYNTKYEVMKFEIDFRSKVLDNEKLEVHKPGYYPNIFYSF